MLVRKTFYNDTQMTDINSLSNALLQRPDRIAPVLTHLGGREDKRFPLFMMTEGAGNVESVNTLEYDYNVKTRITLTRPVTQTPSVTADLGKGGQIFHLSFPDKWFIKDYTLISASGVQVRIQDNPVPNGSGAWNYPVRLINPDPEAIMPASDVQGGKLFGQLFAAVGTDWSRGNASNWEAPATIRHKLTTLRKSYQFSGKAQNYVMEVKLPTGKGGGTSLFWMDYEEWQRMLQWKEECESFLWYSNQSYDANGVTPLTDENGQPVIIGPGLLDQIINKDTYSELTEAKIENTIGDLFYGMTDAQEVNVTLYTGTGGAREFDRAMKKAINANQYRVFNDGKFVSGSGRNLTLTGFFTTYEHIDGHTVRVVKMPGFDHGAVAQAADKHPKTGYSLESYRMVFVDQSRYDGVPNLRMVSLKGHEMKRWAVPGSVVPKGFDQSTSRASDIDGASVHFLKVGGVVLSRFDTSLDLRCVAA